MIHAKTDDATGMTDTLLILDSATVARLLDPDSVTSAVRDAFLLHSAAEGRVFPVIREPLRSGVFGIKAGLVADQALLGFKAAGFWPANRTRGGEPHQATVMLFDPETGRPYALMDGNAITTLRTGAAGGLGLSQFARPDSASLTLFGTGVQATIQLEFALRTLPQLVHVNYLTHDDEPDADFMQRFEQRIVLHHQIDADYAVSRSDVVITATPGGKTLFSPGAVRKGTHINAVGADTLGKRELSEGVLAQASVFVDDAVQSRQLGELQWAPETACVEIGQVLAGQAGGRLDADQITVFDMTGIALQDLTVARMLYDAAAAHDLGTRLPWPWR